MIEPSHLASSSINIAKIDHHNNGAVTKKKPNKSTHVPTACINCKKAHLACDLSRPCKRCSALGKCDTCIDIKHKKRGRPKLTAASKKSSNKTNNSSIPTTPPQNNNNFISLLPMAAPGLSACSFNLTNKNNNKSLLTADQLPSNKSEMMTIFLSMDLCCARVSDESLEYLKIHPNSIEHCSFYDLIHSDSSETLSRIHRLLLDNSHSTQTQHQPISFTATASSDLFLTSSPAQLFQIANGSQTLRETLKFKASGKNMSCRFYLGGGFGADLFRPETLDHLYMVCIVSELNSITSASNIVVTAQPPYYQQQQQQKQQQQQHESVITSPTTTTIAHNDNNLIDSLLFDQDDSILASSELMSMYNNSTPPTNENEAMQLVSHLCEAMMAPPTTPPLYDFKGYYSSNSSIEGNNNSNRYTLLDHDNSSALLNSSFKSSILDLSYDTLLTNNNDAAMYMLSPSSKEEVW